MLQGIEDAVRSKFNRIDKCILRVNSWINGGSGTVIICKPSPVRTPQLIYTFIITPKHHIHVMQLWSAGRGLARRLGLKYRSARKIHRVTVT